MRVAVDAEACTACGLCAQGCPAVFVMGEEVAEVIADPVPADQEDAARRAAGDCPVEAISVRD